MIYFDLPWTATAAGTTLLQVEYCCIACLQVVRKLQTVCRQTCNKLCDRCMCSAFMKTQNVEIMNAIQRCFLTKISLTKYTKVIQQICLKL